MPYLLHRRQQIIL